MSSNCHVPQNLTKLKSKILSTNQPLPLSAVETQEIITLIRMCEDSVLKRPFYNRHATAVIRYFIILKVEVVFWHSSKLVLSHITNNTFQLAPSIDVVSVEIVINKDYSYIFKIPPSVTAADLDIFYDEFGSLEYLYNRNFLVFAEINTTEY